MVGEEPNTDANAYTRRHEILIKIKKKERLRKNSNETKEADSSKHEGH